jgi:hypothetical protein
MVTLGVMDMQQIIMDTSALRLPEVFAERIGTQQVLLREVPEGVMLVPVKKAAKPLYGLLKGMNYSTARYLEQKQQDKELEL